MPTFALASWLLTFLLHSTLLGLAALVASRVARRPEARAVLLRGGLLGALATATLVSVVGLGPRIGVPNLEPDRGRPIALRPQDDAAPGVARAATNSAPRAEGDMADRPAPQPARGRAGVTTEAVPPQRTLELTLALALLIAVAFGAARFLRSALAARARLALRLPLGRSPEHTLHGARVAALLATLDAPHGVRISVSRDLDVPLAHGRSELVLPARALADLDDTELRALLAHELAHLARRDPLWLGAARLVHALTWFQPLQRALLRRLEDESELATDASAVARTHDPLALARTLERVARWIAAGPTPALGVAMARRGAIVLTRIERLVAQGDVAAPRTTGRLTAATLSIIALIACVAPGCTTEARVGISGAEAFALLAPVIGLADEPDKPIWKLATRDSSVLDFGERPWRASAPQLVLHLGHDPEHPRSPPIHAFGQRLRDADAAAALARIAKDCCPPLEVLVATTPEATEGSIAELMQALERADVPASHAVVRHSLAQGNAIDTLRLGPHEGAAPVRIVLYDGPDAEPNEQRFVLRLDERGELRGVPKGQVPFELVANRLRSARTGPLDPEAQGPQVEVIQDRLLIECEAATPFDEVLHWLAALAGAPLTGWKMELGPAGGSDADVIEVFLPSDAGPTSANKFYLFRNGAIFDLELLQRALRVDRDVQGLVYRMSKSKDDRIETRNLGELIERAFQSDVQLTLDVRPPVTFGEVLPLLRQAEEHGTIITFVGAFTPSPLHEPRD